MLFQHLAWEAVALDSRVPTTASTRWCGSGTSAANTLTGGGGDDRLHGQAGADVLNGGLGRDS